MDVGKSEQRELANRMAILLAHLLKWQHQPERRGASWERTIKAQRKEIAYHLDETASLRPKLLEPRWLGYGLGQGPCPSRRGNGPGLFSRCLPLDDG